MSKNILDIEIFSAWNTYAVSMMSVLENCGMWPGSGTFQRFLCETGISAQFCVDKSCSPLPITDYDWLDDNTFFMARIGVQTKKYFFAPQDPEYSVIQQEAVQAVKDAIDNKKAAVVWGIDTGEFGVVYGYDDEDKVFYAKGIGSQNTDASLPILYSNLGKTFEYAPVLYCEIPQSHKEVDSKAVFAGFLKQYVQEMNRISENPERAYGFSAYDMLIDAVRRWDINEFGLRYCTGIYFERKGAILLYLKEIQKEAPSELLSELIDSFGKTAGLYRKLMFDILQENTEGWNYLSSPISKDCCPEILEVLNEMKQSEAKSVAIAERILWGLGGISAK